MSFDKRKICCVIFTSLMWRLCAGHFVCDSMASEWTDMHIERTCAFWNDDGDDDDDNNNIASQCPTQRWWRKHSNITMHVIDSISVLNRFVPIYEEALVDKYSFIIRLFCIVPLYCCCCCLPLSWCTWCWACSFVFCCVASCHRNRYGNCGCVLQIDDEWCVWADR